MDNNYHEDYKEDKLGIKERLRELDRKTDEEVTRLREKLRR